MNIHVSFLCEVKNFINGSHLGNDMCFLCLNFASFVYNLYVG